MTIGEKIKFHRKKKGLTQDELAAILHVGKQAICKYEKGVVENLPMFRVQELARALDVEPEYLIGWETDAPAPDPLTEKRQKVVDAVMQLSDEQLEGLLAFLKK